MYDIDEKIYEDQYDKKFQLGTNMVRDIALNTMLDESCPKKFPLKIIELTVKSVNSPEEAMEIKDYYDDLKKSKDTYCISFLMDQNFEDSETGLREWRKCEDNYKNLIKMIGLDYEKDAIDQTTTIFDSNVVSHTDLQDSVDTVWNYLNWMRESYLKTCRFSVSSFY